MHRATARLSCRLLWALFAGLLIPADVLAQNRAMFSRASAPETEIETASAGHIVVRSRRAAADLTLLAAGGASADASGTTRTAARSVDLNLFDDVNLVAQFDRVESVTANSFAWIGDVAGVRGSTVILSVAGGVLTGTVKLPGRLYSIHQTAGGYEIAEIDAAAMPADGAALPQRTSAAAPAYAAAPAERGDQIDLLLYYTPAVKQAIGGAAALDSYIAASIAEVNAVYVSSGIAARVRLVGALEIAYAESGSSLSDLAALRVRADVRAARDRYGADLVSMLVARDAASSGTAYISVSQGQSFEDYGYSVAVYYPHIGYVYSLAHELGHNFGCLHEAGNNGGSDATGAFSFSLGYTDAAHGFHDVMSYGSGCPSCIGIDEFSNPLITYNGNPVGTANHDSVRTINVTRTLVANYRAAATAAPSVPRELRSTVTGATVSLNWRAPATGAPAAYVIEAGSSSGLADLASVPVGGTATMFAGVGAGTYYVRVKATDAAGTSGPSNEITLLVGAAR